MAHLADLSPEEQASVVAPQRVSQAASETMPFYKYAFHHPIKTAEGFGKMSVGLTPMERTITGAMVGGDVVRALAPLVMESTAPVALAASLAPTVAAGVRGYREAPPGQKLAGTLMGAGEGLVSSVVPEAAARGAGKLVTRVMDNRTLRNAIATSIPPLASAIRGASATARRGVGSVVSAVNDLFRGGEATRLATDALNATNQRIEQTLGETGIPISSRFVMAKSRSLLKGKLPLPFRDVDNRISELWHIGYSRKGDPVNGLTPAMARREGHELLTQLTQALHKIDPNVARAYSKARLDMQHTMILKRLFENPEIFQRDRIVRSALMKRAQSPWVQEALRRTPEGRGLLRSFFRDAEPTAADAPMQWGSRVGIRSTGGVMPAIYPRGLGYHVGRQIPIPRTPALIPFRNAVDALFPMPDQGAQ